MKYGKPHIMHGEGEGATLYLGSKRGAPFISVDLGGFHGWQSSRLIKQGWSFFTPTLHLGRLFETGGNSWSRRVLLPSSWYDFYLWKIKYRGFRSE